MGEMDHNERGLGVGFTFLKGSGGGGCFRSTPPRHSVLRDLLDYGGARLCLSGVGEGVGGCGVEVPKMA